jgi:hypothetical protein
MFDLVMPAAFEDIHKTDNIAIDVCIGVGNRVSDTCLGSKVNNSVESTRDT